MLCREVNKPMGEGFDFVFTTAQLFPDGEVLTTFATDGASLHIDNGALAFTVND
jgi:hypothetical protein